MLTPRGGVAEEAAKAQPAVGWAGQAVLDYRCADADWAGALDALEHMKGALEKADYRRKRAVLLDRACAGARRHRPRQLRARWCSRRSSWRPIWCRRRRWPDADWRKPASSARREKFWKRAWAINPHPDIAEAYANVRLGDSARERLDRMQKLAGKVPGQLEGALAVARAALDAREFADRARRARALSLGADPARRDA